MTYTWNKEELQKQKKELQILLHHKDELTKEETKSIKSTLHHINNMLNQGNEKPKTTLPSKRIYLDEDQLLPKITYKKYLELPQEIKKILLEAFYCFTNFRDQPTDLPTPTAKLTEEDIINLSHDFFKWLPSPYEKKFLKFVDKRKNLIQFGEQNSNIVGSTYPLTFPVYDPHFWIAKTGSIEDSITLNHEIAHGIYTEYSPYSPDFTGELEGCYFDFLSEQFLSYFVDSKTIDSIKNNRFALNYHDLKSFFLIFSSTNQFNKNDRISLFQINNQTRRNHLPFTLKNKQDLRSVLQENPTELANCRLSYLVSCDLEKIFNKDPEYSFYLFEQIKNHPKKYLFQTLEENHITFFEDGLKNFKEQVKQYQKSNRL